MSNIATFKTSMGTFKAELYTDKMPVTWYAAIPKKLSLKVAFDSCGTHAICVLFLYLLFIIVETLSILLTVASMMVS